MVTLLRCWKLILQTASVILIFVINFVLLLLIYSVLNFNKVIHLSHAPENLTVSTKTETTVNGIPLIIHQIFMHTYLDSIPSRRKRAQKSWTDQSVKYGEMRHYNEFVYILWTDDQIDVFVREQYPWFYKAFQSYSMPVCKTDALKYLLLYHFGGIYSDLDVGSNAKQIRYILSSIQNKGIALMGTTPYGFATDLIIAAKGHPFLKYVITGLIPAQIDYPFSYITAMVSTGPIYLTGKYALYKNKEEIWALRPTLYAKYFQQYGGSSKHN